MKDTFHGWSDMGEYKLDTVVDYILTGRTAVEAKPDEWLIQNIGPQDQPLKLLDFGCGVGRNTFGAAIHRPQWWVVGYDNEGMLSKKNEFFSVHYNPPLPCNVVFSSDWEKIKLQQFDVIFCTLVLQHIYEDALVVYLKDFKNMAKKLIVSGRRINDDPKSRSTWTILQENRWIPTVFLQHETPILFAPEGAAEEHNAAIYDNTIVF